MRSLLRHSMTFIITCSIVVFIGLIVLVLIDHNSTIKLKTLNTDNYVLNYDSTWSIYSKGKDYVTLKHKSSSSLIDINISELNNEYKYLNLSQSINNILYSIEQNNSTLKLVSTEQININNTDSYKALYNNGDKETLLTFIKESNKMIMFDLTADSKYFDLLIDSYNEIVKGFSLNHKKIDLSSKINISNNKIKWKSNNEIDKLIKDNYNFEINDLNYYVSYSIPKIFKLEELNTINNRFSYRTEDYMINIKTYNRESNIYEYLNNSKDKYTIYYEYDYLNDEDNYKEYISKIDDNFYIYKNTYKKDKKPYENVKLIYSLDNNHLFIIELSSSKCYISEKLISSIKLNSYNKYSSNITRKVEDNKLITTIKYFIDSNKDKYNRIDIKLPLSFKELDKGNNKYMMKYFTNNTVNLKYYLTRDISINNNLIKSNYSVYSKYGKYNINKNSVKKLHNRDYYLYDGYYYDKINMIRSKILYTMIDDYYLVIEIESRNNINDSIINDVTEIDSKIGG